MARKKDKARTRELKAQRGAMKAAKRAAKAERKAAARAAKQAAVQPDAVVLDEPPPALSTERMLDTLPTTDGPEPNLSASVQAAELAEDERFDTETGADAFVPMAGDESEAEVADGSFGDGE